MQNSEKRNDYDAELSCEERRKNRRELMRRVVLAELVPFGSMSPEWVNNETVDICWDSYNKEVLEKSVAPVFILYGRIVREQFLRKAITEGKERERARCAFQNNEIYDMNFGELPRKVVYVYHPSRYTYNFLDRYGNSKVSEILRKTISGLVRAQ